MKMSAVLGCCLLFLVSVLLAGCPPEDCALSAELFQIDGSSQIVDLAADNWCAPGGVIIKISAGCWTNGDILVHYRSEKPGFESVSMLVIPNSEAKTFEENDLGWFLAGLVIGREPYSLAGVNTTLVIPVFDGVTDYEVDIPFVNGEQNFFFGGPNNSVCAPAEGEGEGEGEGEDIFVTVPDLTGLNWAQAEGVLSAVDLVVGDIDTTSSSTVPANIISSWSPTGLVLIGTAIDLTISLGPVMITVPDLSGLTENQAINRINQTCLTVGEISRANSSTIPAGIVSNWNPRGSVPCGTAIDLTISLGPVIPPEMSVSIIAPASGSVYSVGDVVTVEVRAQGDPAGGPYRLVVRNAELVTRTIDDLALGWVYSFHFPLNLRGSGNFTAYLESSSGSSVSTYLAYSVF